MTTLIDTDALRENIDTARASLDKHKSLLEDSDLLEREAQALAKSAIDLLGEPPTTFMVLHGANSKPLLYLRYPEAAALKLLERYGSPCQPDSQLRYDSGGDLNLDIEGTHIRLCIYARCPEVVKEQYRARGYLQPSTSETFRCPLENSQ